MNCRSLEFFLSSDDNVMLMFIFLFIFCSFGMVKDKRNPMILQ